MMQFFNCFCLLFRQVLNQAVSQAPCLPPPNLRGGFQALLQDRQSLPYCPLFMGFSLPPAGQGGAGARTAHSLQLPVRGSGSDTARDAAGTLWWHLVSPHLQLSPSPSAMLQPREGRVWRWLSASYKPLRRLLTPARRISREKLRERLYLPFLSALSCSIPLLAAKRVCAVSPAKGRAEVC